jgi:hypothetical protein
MHIVKKQSIQIDFQSVSDGFALQSRVSALFHEKILPGMEALFNEFSDDEHTIVFDTLNIDCGLLADQRWEEEWVQQTLYRLRQELLAAGKSRNYTSIDRTDKLQAAFLYYIQHGYLPWNSPVPSVDLLEQFVPGGVLLERLRQVIQQQPNAADRLVHSFSETFTTRIIGRLATINGLDTGTLTASIGLSASPEQKRIVQVRILQTLCAGLSESLCTWQPEIAAHREPVAEAEHIYVEDAGLVILHPFLQQLFETCGLLHENQWTDAAVAPHTAAIVLRYLLLGTSAPAGGNLILHKVLCGLDPGTVILPDKELSDHDTNACLELLVAAIGHWAVLKNTGVDAFRETFLQRNGKLSRVDGGWLLQVEQKGVDVLLSLLPWGIGAIRLPWMSEIVYVDWC